MTRTHRGGPEMWILLVLLLGIAGGCTDSGDTSADTNPGRDAQASPDSSEPGETSADTNGSVAHEGDTDCEGSNLPAPALWPGQAEPERVALPPGPTVAKTEGLLSALEVLGIQVSGDEPASAGPACSVLVGEPLIATVYLDPVADTYRVTGVFQPTPEMTWGYAATGSSIQVFFSRDFCGGEPTCEVEVSVRFGEAEVSDSAAVDARGGDLDLAVPRDATTPGTILIHGTDRVGSVVGTVGTQLPAGDSAAG